MYVCACMCMSVHACMCSMCAIKQLLKYLYTLTKVIESDREVSVISPLGEGTSEVRPGVVHNDVILSDHSIGWRGRLPCDPGGVVTEHTEGGLDHTRGYMWREECKVII